MTDGLTVIPSSGNSSTRQIMIWDVIWHGNIIGKVVRNRKNRSFYFMAEPQQVTPIHSQQHICLDDHRTIRGAAEALFDYILSRF